MWGKWRMERSDYEGVSVSSALVVASLFGATLIAEANPAPSTSNDGTISPGVPLARNRYRKTA
jgi:hypothetical protein